MTTETPAQKRKLIEVALPLESINRESAREKSIRHGHPSTLHLWWARRPLAAARAVLFAQLVDDPSSHPDEFPTEELQREERERLHKLIDRLVVWENSRDEKLLAEAHAEILKSTNGNPPPILDPFAGGGTIPLEAQRLGLVAHASDLNPVAVLINKALIEIPPEFRDQPPVFPGLSDSEIRSWHAAEGLAADVRAYGAWMRDEAEKRIGHLYPKATLPDGSEATVIAWVWARAVDCPNPACGAEVPLLSSLDLRKKKGQEVWLRPVVDQGFVDFKVTSGPRQAQPNKRGQGAKFECWVCGAGLTPNYIHEQLDVATKPPYRLLADIVSGDRQRIFVDPTRTDLAAADAAKECAKIIRAEDAVLNAEARGTFGGNAQGRRYGFFTFADYFTDRQLVALATLSDLVVEARDRIVSDGGSPNYSDAVATYLAMVISKVADRGSSLVTWVIERASTRNTFARQAISMAWDFIEANQFTEGTGSWSGALEWTCKSLEGLRVGPLDVSVKQADARDAVTDHAVIATDPPYYDNISYSDLSDFFYVWLRRSLRNIHPELFRTVLVPKANELIANSYRHDGAAGAKKFFEDGFRAVFAEARKTAFTDYPISVWYAFKQSESDDAGTASSGWETLLEGMTRSGWEITSTWPIRGERGGRTISLETNALASAIVLTLRPRSTTASTTDRRGFIAALESELPTALRSLQQGQIAPVDLPQAAIGPGMAVFSRYVAVLEPDGSEMTVRSALARINEILDQVLNEQEGDFDATSRFAIAWYRQHGYSAGKYGDAELLANARGAVVQSLDRDGVLVSRAGRVQLIEPALLSEDYDILGDLHTSNWEALHHLIRKMENDGIRPAGDFLNSALHRTDAAVDADLVKELAHLLFRIAENNGWTKDAVSFNSLVTSWPEIWDASRANGPDLADRQSEFDFEVEES